MSIDLNVDFAARLHQMVQAIVTVLAVINPVVCGAIFLTLTPKLLPSQIRWAAVKVTLSILIILVASALIGLKVLSIFIALHGIRYAQRTSYGQPSPAYGSRRCSGELVYAAHHVRRWSGDDHRRGNVGRRSYAR